ncbi:MAG: CarD family transcriptional regulator, partial [Gemmatimonadales bacterium]
MTLDPILDAFDRCATIRALAERIPARGITVRLGGLPGSSGAVLGTWLAQRHRDGRLIVVVAPSPPDAERWLTDLQNLGARDVALYPQREALGEDEPHFEIAGERVETLEALLRGRLRVLVTTARATAERSAVPASLESLRLRLATGGEHPPRDVAARLEAMGYSRVPTVSEVAEYSVRGGIIDVYGFGMAQPARLEWWGDVISSIRAFDLTTQRSGADLPDVTMLPIRSAAESLDRSGAIERRSLLELLPGDALVLEERTHPDQEEVERAWREAEHHLEVARRLGEDVPRRDDLFVAPDDWRTRLGGFARFVLRDETCDLQLGFFPPERIDRDLQRLRSLLGAAQPTLILCDNEGQRERLDELLEVNGYRPAGTTLLVGALDGGFVMPTLRVLTDHEIFRRARRLRRTRRYRQAAPTGVTGALAIGDYVVHLEHGIGIFRGIAAITVEGGVIEVAVLEYEGGDRLNVPLYRLDQLERYRTADSDAERPPPRLHRIGGTHWKKVREKARRAIQAMAAELLDLYARRKTVAGYPFPPDTRWQRELESSFLYEDTPDQRTATDDIKRDMERPIPMDRLLVGDVGYGKTEVAVRAAFKAVQGGKQVAVLVQTTILAEQHFRT